MKTSYSSIRDFKECPRKWALKREWEQVMKSSALFFGSTVEAGIDVLIETGDIGKAYGEFKKQWHTRPENRYEGARQLFDSNDIFYYASDYDSKLLTHYNLKVTKMWYNEIFEDDGTDQDPLGYADVIADMIKKGESITDAQRKFYHRVVWLCCRQRGMLMIKAFQDNILPNIEAVEGMQVETSITSEDAEVVGFVDYIAKMQGQDGYAIVDLKSSGKFYEAHELDTSDQLRSSAVKSRIRTIRCGC